MEDIRSVQMSDDETDEFLQAGGTGVISFPSDAGEPPYSLPVSYGYDTASGNFYFRLAFGPDTQKQSVIGEGPVSFVTYDHTDDGWRSVVATGELEEVTEATIDSEAFEGLHQAQIPLVDVFDRHPRELTFKFYRLVSSAVTGRKEALTED
ncbi:MAG: pyridoxamine 5'-phosphate oxidase family protein [Halobacteriota archaeon]